MKKKDYLKIALVTDGIYPFVMGGMQMHSYYLAKFLSKNKIYIDLYYYVDNNKPKLDEVFDKDSIKYLNFFQVKYPKTLWFPGNYLYKRYLYSKRILKILLKQKPYHFIYVKGFSGWALLKNKKKLNIKTCIGINFHGYEMFQKWPSFVVGLKLQTLKLPVINNLNYSDYIFSYGGKISEIIAKLGFKNKIVEIPTGVDKSLISHKAIKKDEILKVVFLGRSERRKGIVEINNVISRIDHSLRIEFHFIGPIKNKLKLSDPRTTYYGLISETNKKIELLDSMDILICPSYSEGMPNVIMEGMARGLAIIATNVGATSRMVSKENGWLISPDNLEKNLYNAIMDAYKFDKLEKMKKKSILKAQSLEWDTVILDLINFLKKVNNC